MQKKSSFISYIILLTASSFPSNGQVGNKGLKDYFQNFFPVGVAVKPQSLQGPEAELILRHFNSITAENAMKMGPIHPEENRYNWEDADKIVAFATTHDIKIRGHNLCWHEQTPKWLFVDKNNKFITKDVLLQRLKDHIHHVVSRYKGKIYAWDVVNEAVADDSTALLRNSLWMQICGDEFIAKAFEYAHQEDPAAKLYYNDYNTERPEKRERIYKLLKKLKDANVPIHGVGLQGHWSIYEPTDKELIDAIAKFSSLGLDVQITELDVSIYPWEKSIRELKPGETDELTRDLEQKQIDRYTSIFRIFRENKTSITGVTFWNLSDRDTWLNNYPVKGRKNYPLLFDRNLHEKKVFKEVIKF